MPANQAFVTLATTDSYCMGALVVGQCLRRHRTTRQTVVMVSTNVSSQARAALGHVFDQVLVVDVLDSGDQAHLSWLGRPELGVTFTKLHCWTLTQYRKCVFLDADTLVLCNVDELFEREELSAAPDPGWPDCFNSGVFVFRPSLITYGRLLEHARQHGSFDGGDQGLLNTFFSDWAVRDISKHLPFVYNLSAITVYTYLPAYQEYGHNAKIVHFLGSVKPWNLRSNSQTNQHTSSHLEEFVYQWWMEYSYLHLLIKTMSHQEPAVPIQHAGPKQHKYHRERSESSTLAPYSSPLYTPISTVQTITLLSQSQGREEEKAEAREEEKAKAREEEKPKAREEEKPKAREEEKPKAREEEKPKAREEEKPKAREEEKPKAREEDKPKAREEDKPKAREEDKPKGREEDKPKGREEDKPKGREEVKPKGREEDKPKGRKEDKPKGREVKPKGRGATVSLIEDLTESLLRKVTLLTEERKKRLDSPTQPGEMRTQRQDVSPGKEGGTGDRTANQDPPGPSGEGSEVTDTAFNPMEDPATEPTAAKAEEDDLEQRRLWEEGQADYLGKDAFDNIQKKLDRFLYL
ncbi:glycogenin-1 isoform X1 [Salmo salar]|uniref:glycogenin glucosyltransferase n=1 Tax=Salmo salar TaxID=8030 RepID=A0ABM3D7I0_SALSA|nr:glycogenin-1 isoform X1 [Salmo salar]